NMPLSTEYTMLLVLIAIRVLGAAEEQSDCKMIGPLERPLLYKAGDVLVGGAFSLHSQISRTPTTFTNAPDALRCTRINSRELRFAHTMIFAIEEINNNNDLLPNISIGYKVLDSCGAAQQAVMVLMNGQVGETLCSTISHFATCACLSNRKDYPTFFRTIPSDYYQSRALAKLVKHFGWTWVGAVRSDNDYGNNGMATFVAAAAQEGVCVEYSEAISRTDSQDKVASVVKTIRHGTAKVLVAFLAQGEIDILLEEAVKQNMTGVQWVGSESWITAGYLATQRYSGVLTGSLGFTLQRADIPGLKEFLLQINPIKDPQNSLLKEFWEETFGCSFQAGVQNQVKCTGSEKLRDTDTSFTDVSELRISHNVYKAVYAVAHALHNIIKCSNMVDQGCISQTTIKPFQVRLDNHVHFTLKSDSAKCTQCPLDYWSNKNNSQCVLKVIEFLSYGETMGALLAALSLFGGSLTMMVMCVFFWFRHTPLVKASNSFLSFLLLISLTLCFLCSLTFIGRPSKWSCMLRHTAFGITFALCMSCLLAKTIAVVMAFKLRRPGNTVPQCSVPIQRTSVFVFTSLQVLVCVLWLALAPPIPHKNTAYAKDRIILECHLGSDFGFWAVLSYIGLLAILCFILAFLARKLPDNFNEAKFITFSMLIFCAVWITFIPAYVSSPGKFTVAVEIFAILASSFGLLFCIFMPKCYILLLRPEKNTQKNMMGRIN
uniref:Olfactory receptor C family, j1 n=1 Tax=Neogobius melanostomus TaxID=47308 RepID=A0A8C6WLC9_9GOBI